MPMKTRTCRCKCPNHKSFTGFRISSTPPQNRCVFI
jgi:hypothetical protein